MTSWRLEGRVTSSSGKELGCRVSLPQVYMGKQNLRTMSQEDAHDGSMGSCNFFY